MRVLGRRIPVSLLVYTTRHCILVRWPLYEERVSSPKCRINRVSANLNRGSAMLPMVCPAGAAEIRISIAGLRMQS